MSDIYVVCGSTGEYSDKSEWTVCFYRTLNEAQAHAEKAETRAKEIASAIQEIRDDPSIGYSWDAEQKLVASNEFDPYMRLDYTGTTYYVCVVPDGTLPWPVREATS